MSISDIAERQLSQFKAAFDFAKSTADAAGDSDSFPFGRLPDAIEKLLGEKLPQSKMDALIKSHFVAGEELPIDFPEFVAVGHSAQKFYGGGPPGAEDDLEPFRAADATGSGLLAMGVFLQIFQSEFVDGNGMDTAEQDEMLQEVKEGVKDHLDDDGNVLYEQFLRAMNGE